MSTAMAVTLGAALVTQTGTASAATKAAGASTPKPTVVVAGLNNPRQIQIGWDGALYIAEAGHGGSTCIGSGEDETCVGLTSSVSRVATPWKTTNSAPVRIITGLPSGGGPDGSFAVGVDGVSLRGQSVFAQETFAPPDVLPSAPAYQTVGKLLEKEGSGRVTIRADISAAEAKYDPDGNGFDSDPYAVLALDDRILVADAAANAVFQVQGSKVSVWAVFEDVQPSGSQFVPTYLTLGPNGHVYVGGLGGETPGAGKIVELTRSGHKVAWYNGFTTVTGVAVGTDGTLYVSELFGGSGATPGQLTIAKNGHRTHIPVPFPAGVALGSNGGVYVSAWSVAPATGLGGGLATSGQIWRFAHLAG
jgi:hypothetical protein